MKTKLLIVGLLLLGSIAVLAQEETPRFEALGAYSYFNASTSGQANRFSLNGWDGALNINLNKWVGITSDLGGYYGSPSFSGIKITTHDYSFLFGPTFTYRTKRVSPFAHVLFGGNHITGSVFGLSGSDTTFALAVGGGVDLPVHSMISIRAAQVDWMQTHHFGTSQNNVRVSSGVVLRFGQ